MTAAEGGGEGEDDRACSLMGRLEPRVSWQVPSTTVSVQRWSCTERLASSLAFTPYCETSSESIWRSGGFNCCLVAYGQTGTGLVSQHSHNRR